DRIADGLRAVTLNHRSLTDERLVARAAELYCRDGAVANATLERDTSEPLPTDFDVRHTMAEAYDELAMRAPERVGTVVRALERYDDVLTRTGLRDRDVATAGRSVRSVCRTLLAVVGWLPVALPGTLINWIPYRALGAFARRRAPSSDVIATYK